MNGDESGKGNQALQALLLDRRAQAKLSVSQVDDPLEREADDVATRVMGTGVDRKAAGHQAPQADGGLTTQVDNLRGGGTPLPESTRDFFEPRFGQDFGAVRIHTDARAAASARSIDALAYTHGRDIVFAQGQYRPDNSQGKRLLAHELAHVVQQGRGASGQLASGTVQRECGPAIGTPTGCDRVPMTTEPTGQLVRFEPNCDVYASDSQFDLLVEFTDQVLATDRVRVHGFASMSGDEAFNWDLSCARARRAAAALSTHGIDSGHIEVIAHGPTPGPERRRSGVVLEIAGGGTRTPRAQLTATVAEDPTVGDCGEFDFLTFWRINRPASSVGGFVIQEVTVTRVDDDCSGNPIPWGHESPLHFYEAWQVLPGTRGFLAEDTDTDRFWWDITGSQCATGRYQVNAQATYFDNVAALPSHMIRDNPATTGGHLRSSRRDPELGGTPSRPVPHRLLVTWDCCPCVPAPSVIVSHTP